MHISAKADYGVRAAVEIAAAEQGHALTGPDLARAQAIPAAFLANILNGLDRAGIVHAHRGRHGGYRLARPASEISIADILRAVEGPLATVQSERPENLTYAGAAKRLPEVWIAMRGSLRAVLEHVTLDQIAERHLPVEVNERTRNPDAWTPR